MTWIATMFSMIVDKISLTPRYAFSAPGIAPQIPPPTRPAMRTKGIMTSGGKVGRYRTVTVDKSAPETICPSPPILMTSALKAIQIPTPTSSKGIARTAVSASASVSPKAP